MSKKRLEAVSLDGVFEITHRRGNEVLSVTKIHNTVTNAGRAEVAGLINEATSGGFKWLELDSSSTAVVVGDTALASAITSPSLARASATCSRTETSVANDTAQLLHTWTSSATQTVQGVGVFDDDTDGIMLAGTTFEAKNMAADDTIEIKYRVKCE